MGRAPCCEKNGLKKGPWTQEEDQKLIDYIQKHGYGNWRLLPKNAGLQRCGKSCRLRWTNYLRPDIKRGRFSFEEEETIIQLHSILGNKWSAIACRLPGRTDNEIKNYWNTHIRKRLLRMGIDPVTHSPRLDLLDLSSVINSSLYACSSQVDIQRLFGTQPLVNPEILKLASSLFSSSSQQQHQENQLCNNPQIQNHQFPHFVDQSQESAQEAAGCSIMNLNPPNCVSLPFTTREHLVESNSNANQLYPSISPDFGGLQQQHAQFISDWHCNNNGIDSSTVTEDCVPSSLPSYNNYYFSSDYHHANDHLMDPPVSETTTFHSHNNSSNQNFSFASVLSTPSSSPKPLNSNSTYISSTEDETESYVSSNMFGFQIPDILGVNEFM